MSITTGRTKSAEDLTSILDYLRDEVRPVIARIAGSRSCLQTCSVVEQVLRGCGYQVQTLGVVFQIFNDVCVAQVTRGEDIDVNAPGAFARQVGGRVNVGGAASDGWQGAGHVINLVPEFQTLIDFSIDQVNDGHPEDPAPRELGVLPFYATPPGDRLKAMRWGHKPLTMIGDGSNGRPYMLTYYGVPTDKSHLTAETYTSPIWTKLAQKVLREVRNA